MNELSPVAIQAAGKDPAAEALALMPADLKLAVEQAFQSGLYGKLNRWEAAAKISTGRELGLNPMQSLQSMWIVSGKLVLSYPLLGALVQQSGKYRYKVLEQTDKVARVEFLERVENDVQQADGTWRTVRTWESAGVSTFSIDMAKRANLLGKGPWMQYPEIMLFARALSAGVRIYCPSLTMQPVYTVGELDEDRDQQPAPRTRAVKAAEVVTPIVDNSTAVPRQAVLQETVADIIGANS